MKSIIFFLLTAKPSERSKQSPKATPLLASKNNPANTARACSTSTRKWREPLPFAYESTGVETQFTNQLDPSPKSRNGFAFHRPETLLEYLEPNANLNSRLANLLTTDQMPTSNLWSAQIKAIGNLEKSLAANKRRALIQIATGRGKTYTAVNFVYRLIKLAGARHVLFLVDRGNLGDQTLKEFQQFVTPDDGRKFTELYNVQHLQSAQLDRVSRVCISTIQRLYSMLPSLLFWIETRTPQGQITRGDRQRAVRIQRHGCYITLTTMPGI